MNKRLSLCAALLLSACTRGTDHERLGDRRYAERAWIDAMAEYRLAARQHKPSVELRAKLAAAALHAGQLGEAAKAYADLGRSDPSAGSDAAEGLVRVSRAAIAARDVEALRLALSELRGIAPQRLAELGSGLALAVAERRLDDAPDLLLAAAAGSSGAMADSLMAAWADALARTGRCDVAARAFDALMRRDVTQGVSRAARGGLAGCRLEAGRAALAAGQLDAAEQQFRDAIGLGMPDSVVRLSWVLIGDARWANGDTATAIDSYRKATVGADDDNPIAQRARDQLKKLTGNTETP